MSAAQKSNEGALSRALAAKTVHRVFAQGWSLDRAFRSPDLSGLKEADLSQVKAFSYGALRHLPRYRKIIAALVKRPLRKQDRILEALLAIGLYQIVQGGQPDYASVSATVAAAGLLDRRHASGMINACLRRFLRERDSILERVMEDDEARHVHPDWLLQRLRRDWPEHWESIVAAANLPPPMWLRVNRRQSTAEQYSELLQAQDIAVAERVADFPDAIRLPVPVAVSTLPEFAEGMVSVQDAAAQLAAKYLAVEPGMRVLDVCSAPGGKAMHLLELSPKLKELVAVDNSESRLQRVQENLARLKLNATMLTGDALHPEQWWDGTAFERILLDAPCSGTGVIRRHPDIKSLRRESDIAAFAETQLAMLSAIWPLLAPGGQLLYVTCSVLREENHEVIKSFMSSQDDAELLSLPTAALAGLTIAEENSGMQLLPGSTGDTDGFYYALMQRQSA
jgi:16S rRNA (cytosine967-C5)-methyltransferase